MASGSLNDVLDYLRSLSGPATGDLSDLALLERADRHRDETAFAILLQRHGPMVLAVCRRILHDPHAAEDAFQATFLVLLRKAGSIRNHASLAGWLHRVAQRVSLRARAQAEKRSRRERRFETMPSHRTLDDITWKDLRAVLDEELGQLPEKYQSALVLHYLEGKTQEQAARELGVPRTSLASRLAWGRGLLRERLARRGLALSSGLLAATLTARAVFLPAAAAAAGTAVSLADDVVRSLSAAHAKTGIILAALTALALGSGLAAHGMLADAAPRLEPDPPGPVIASPEARDLDGPGGPALGFPRGTRPANAPRCRRGNRVVPRRLDGAQQQWPADPLAGGTPAPGRMGARPRFDTAVPSCPDDASDVALMRC